MTGTVRSCNIAIISESTMFTLLKSKWDSLGPSQQFIAKATFAVCAWHPVYAYLLHPYRIPDRILTRTIGTGTTFIINLFLPTNASKAVMYDDYWPGDAGVSLVRDHWRILSIGDACNGLEIMMIYIGIIVLLPGSIQRKSRYVSLGLLGLILANMFRCVGLQWVSVHHPEMFETTHHYLFSIVMYAVIFLFWSYYVRKINAHEKG